MIHLVVVDDDIDLGEFRRGLVDIADRSGLEVRQVPVADRRAFPGVEQLAYVLDAASRIAGNELVQGVGVSVVGAWIYDLARRGQVAVSVGGRRIANESEEDICGLVADDVAAEEFSTEVGSREAADDAEE